MRDNNYHIEMTVVTPLCVGTGNDNDWVRGIDYVQKDGKVYVLDLQKAAANGTDINKLTELFLKGDEKGICTLLGNQLEETAIRVFPQPAFTQNPIKSFLRTQLYDKPIVAGSSIKGSIRSALFKALRTTEEDNESVFGNMKDGTDFMRFIRVGDIEMPSTLLVNTKLFNLRTDGKGWAGGWKQGMRETTATYNPTGFNTLYECVEPEEKGYGTIEMAGNAYQLMLKYSKEANRISHTNQKTTLMETGIQTLFHAINAATRSYLQKEKAFFEKYTAERSEEVNDCIEKLLGMIPSDDSFCLMKMSAGVGFHSITGDWEYDDYDKTGEWESGKHQGKKKYKSRKIAEYKHALLLMGFVKLRTMSQDETDQANEQLSKEHSILLDNLMAPIKATEEALRLAEEARRQKEREKEEERCRQEAYTQLMREAKQLYTEEQWDQAIAKAREAGNIYPTLSETAALIEQCESAKKIKEFATKEENEKKERFRQPLADVLKGITSVGNLIGTTAKWLKMNEHVFGEDESTIFTEAFHRLSPKEQLNIRKKVKDLEKAVGTESANLLISKVTSSKQ